MSNHGRRVVPVYGRGIDACAIIATHWQTRVNSRKLGPGPKSTFGSPIALTLTLTTLAGTTSTLLLDILPPYKAVGWRGFISCLSLSLPYWFRQPLRSAPFILLITPTHIHHPCLKEDLKNDLGSTTVTRRTQLLVLRLCQKA